MACCCGCPALILRPFWEQYPASIAIPDRAAGLVRLDDANSRRVVAERRLRVQAEYLLVDSTFAAVYAEPETGDNRVVLFGATRFVLDPGGDLTRGLPRLTRLTFTSVRTLDAGPLGGELQCGTARDGGANVVACGWADHGSVAVAVFPGRSVEDSAQTLRALRAATTSRS